MFFSRTKQFSNNEGENGELSGTPPASSARWRSIVHEPASQAFNIAAPFQALDAQRIEGQLSWREVADQIWNLPGTLNAQHNVGQPRDTNGYHKKDTSGQHALFMLRWLGQGPRASPPGAPQDNATTSLPLGWSGLPASLEFKEARACQKMCLTTAPKQTSPLYPELSKEPGATAQNPRPLWTAVRIERAGPTQRQTSEIVATPFVFDQTNCCIRAIGFCNKAAGSMNVR